VAPGVNFAANVDDCPAAIETGSANPDTVYPVPVAAMLEMFSVALPVFDTVTV
jgi:hypothetical protein